MRKLVMGLAVSSMILTACNKAPEVSMTVPSEAKVGESVAMTNNSDVKKVYNAQWSFGDGGVATTWNASHVYSEPGEYTVTLSCTNKKGNMATTQTQAITVTDDGYAAVEAKEEANAVAADAFRSKVAGTWGFTNGSYVEKPCGGGTAVSRLASADAKKMTFVIEGGMGSSYYVNENGDNNSYYISYVDDKHVNVSSVRMHYANSNNQSVDDHEMLEGGIYEYTNTGSVITLTKEEELQGFDSNFNTCYGTTTYSYTLTKK